MSSCLVKKFIKFEVHKVGKFSFADWNLCFLFSRYVSINLYADRQDRDYSRTNINLGFRVIRQLTGISRSRNLQPLMKRTNVLKSSKEVMEDY